jgi:hypothetical protein
MKIYERRNELSIYWYNKSSDLRGSAGALWASMDEEYSDNIVQELSLGTGYRMATAVLPVYEMLCGMAIELIYKAIIIAKGIKPKNPKDFENHKLVVLANLAGISVDDKSNLILQLLTESIYWAGRYPVPKDQKCMENRDKLFGELTKNDSKLGCFHKMSFANDVLSWHSFNRIWLEANRIYCECHQQYVPVDLL